MAEISVKELSSDFLLLTYDIPATKEGKQLRRKFLSEVHSIGAEMHTASVYYMPYSDQAMGLADELQSGGHAIVWRAHQPDKVKAEEMLVKYEIQLKGRCAFIEQRLVAAQEYMSKGNLGIALKMGTRTGKLLQELAQISDNYKTTWLPDTLKSLVAKWKEIYSSGDEKDSGGTPKGN